MRKRTPEQIQALATAFRLYEEKTPDGKKRTWEAVSQILEERGISYTASSLRAEYSRNRVAIMTVANEYERSQRSQRSEPSHYEERTEGKEPERAPVVEVQNERSERCEPDGPVAEPGRDEHGERCEPSGPTELEDRMRAIAREVFGEMITTMQTGESAPIIDQDMPPEPVRTGKAENRRYERVTLTIDRNLWKRVLRESKRLRVSHGRAVDILLWRALGKPRLSYEDEGTEERS